MKDLEEALGQFMLYFQLLNRYEPGRVLYLAVSEDIYKTVFEEEAGEILIANSVIRLVTFDPTEEVIVRWIP